MANFEGIVTEDIANTIAPGLIVYDHEGKRVGTVDYADHENGYFMVETNPFSDRDLYVPFSLITNIDPRDLFVAVSKDELHQRYSNPPARRTIVEEHNGKETAITTEPSGYDGAPIVVERARIDKLKKQIATGDHVNTSEMEDLGTIKQYDPVTGWMLVEQGALSHTRDLMIPVTLVDSVDRETDEVFLAVSQSDLQRMQHLEPANVVFVPAQVRETS